MIDRTNPRVLDDFGDTQPLRDSESDLVGGRLDRWQPSRYIEGETRCM